jgi:hypothetical protein
MTSTSPAYLTMLLRDAPSGDTAHTLTEEPARGLKIAH